MVTYVAMLLKMVRDKDLVVLEIGTKAKLKSASNVEPISGEFLVSEKLYSSLRFVGNCVYMCLESIIESFGYKLS